MSHMTKIPGVPDTDDLVAGMAHYLGTGPVGKTCGDCAHKNYVREGFAGIYYGCAMFLRLTGQDGPAISQFHRCCKYFEGNQPPGHS